MSKYKISDADVVVPEVIKTLEIHLSILETTEGVGNDVLDDTKALIEKLKGLQDPTRP